MPKTSPLGKFCFLSSNLGSNNFSEGQTTGYPCKYSQCNFWHYFKVLLSLHSKTIVAVSLKSNTTRSHSIRIQKYPSFQYETNAVFKVFDNVIIIIIFYFKSVTFFHAKLGSDVCPRVDNQTSGDTLQDLTRPYLISHPTIFYPAHLQEPLFIYQSSRT